MSIAFSSFSPKTPKLDIFEPKFKDFCFCTKLLNNTNSRALITKRTIVFQKCSPKHPNKTFLVPNLRILIFAWNFAIKQIRGRWLQMWQSFLNIPAQRPYRAFLVLSLYFLFLFWSKLYSFTNLRVLIKNLIIVFIKLQPKNT